MVVCLSVPCDRLITCPGASPPMALAPTLKTRKKMDQRRGYKGLLILLLLCCLLMATYNMKVLWLAACIYDSSQSYSVCSSKHECKVEVFLLLSVNGTYGL